MFGLIIRQVLHIASSVGVATIIGNAVRATTPANINTMNKVLVIVGEVAVSTVVGKKVADGMIEIYDENVAIINQAKNSQ